MILFKELDEVNEVLFFNDGTYKIGYELNNVNYFPLKFQNSQVLGAHGATFGQYSEFTYKTVTKCTGYFIRKIFWRNIISSNEYVPNK